jgi:hypothetical protein
VNVLEIVKKVIGQLDRLTPELNRAEYVDVLDELADEIEFRKAVVVQKTLDATTA